jgi:hypothetical protein
VGSGLTAVLIDDPAAEFYVRNKRQACVAAGMRDLHRYLPADVAHGRQPRSSTSWPPTGRVRHPCFTC